MISLLDIFCFSGVDFVSHFTYSTASDVLFVVHLITVKIAINQIKVISPPG